MDAALLSKKLQIILDKLKSDVQSVTSEKLQSVLHSVHTISWVVIQSIVPFIQEEFRGQTIRVFQIISQLVKCMKDTEFEEVSLKLFQMKAQRSRSLKLINCALCDNYRKIPQRQDEKSYYTNYMKQLQKESQQAKEQKGAFGLVMSSNDVRSQTRLNAASQADLIQEPQEAIKEKAEIGTQTEEPETEQAAPPQVVHGGSASLPSDAAQEIKMFMVNYYILADKIKKLKELIQNASNQCEAQTAVIKATQPTIHVLQLKYISTQSIDAIQEVLRQKQSEEAIIDSYQNSILNLLVSPLDEIKREALSILHQRQALEAGVADYDKEFDPAFLPEGQKIMFKVKVENGENVVEEVVVDSKTGAVLRSRARQSQSDFHKEHEAVVKTLKTKEQKLEGDDNGWIMAKYGEKVKVLDKAQNFTSYQVNEDLNKQKIIKIVNQNGQKQIEEEWDSIQQDGKHHHKVYQARGSLIYEDQGEGVAKRWSTKDLPNTEVIFEEFVTKDGVVTRVLEKEKYGQDIIKVIKRDKNDKVISSIVKQVLKDESGELVQHEEEQKQDGHKVIRKIYCQNDEEYQKINEITQLPNGQRKSVLIKKYKDKVESVYVDEYGDEIHSTKYQYVNEQGIMVNCERRINQRTKEQTLQKQYKNNDGRLTVENIVTLDGVELSKQLIVYLSPTERIEKLTKNNKTVESRVTVDEQGNEHVHQVDQVANMNIQTTSFVKDSVEYQKQVINLPNGAKRQIAQRAYYDQNQDKVIEEERVDEFGQRTVIKKRINAFGEEIVEEFQIVETDDQIEFKKLRHTEKRLPRKDQLVEVQDQAIQTDQGGSYQLLEQTLQDFQSDQQLQQDSQKPIKRQSQPQPVIITTAPDFQDIDQQAYNKIGQLKNKSDPQFQEAVLIIKRYFNKNENEDLKQEEFQEYMSKLRQNHQRQCGEQCSHLLRFYAKLGFLIQKQQFNRQVYKLQKVQLQAKEQS